MSEKLFENLNNLKLEYKLNLIKDKNYESDDDDF